ncbi:hypothetical protein [Haloglomus salinum]|uniref:hypothetical protein n=1 Tax=Haloglomus salinum TaxID=2962673 RepID=UPI0020C9D821|nr:hypothetical protein [Haloglomus salinum]
MNVSRIAAPLYPLGLVLANLSAGVGLYETGALGFSLLLWLSGGLVLLGLALSVGHSLTGSLQDPVEDRRWMPF